ncbi:MAG: Demethylmenaquinone methyltransferase, partial [uncultured Blastococcus sp.]
GRPARQGTHRRIEGRPGQASRRRRGHVRRRREALRPHQHRPLGGSGRLLAAGDTGGAGRAPRADRARRRGRDGGLHGRAGRRRGHRHRLRLLAGDARCRGLADGAQDRRGRHGTAAGRRERRRRGHLLRPAQRRRPRRGPARVPPRDPARRHPGDLRVLLAHLDAVPHPLHRVPDEGAAADRPRGQQQPRRLRLPRRVDPGVARPARPGGPGAAGRLGRGRLAEPHRRHRRPAPGTEGL